MIDPLIIAIAVQTILNAVIFSRYAHWRVRAERAEFTSENLRTTGSQMLVEARNRAGAAEVKAHAEVEFWRSRCTVAEEERNTLLLRLANEGGRSAAPDVPGEGGLDAALSAPRRLSPVRGIAVDTEGPEVDFCAGCDGLMIDVAQVDADSFGRIQSSDQRRKIIEQFPCKSCGGKSLAVEATHGPGA